MVRMTATASDHRVERSEWSFVHSETTTRICVTFPVTASRGTDTTLATLLLMLRPPPARPRRRGRPP